MARSRFAVMSMTDPAAERAREFIANAGRPVAGLRVGVKNGGCAGMSYTVEFADEKQPLDEVVEDKGVTLLVDFEGADVPARHHARLRDRARSPRPSPSAIPNQISACGCGELVSLKAAEMPAA